MKIIVVPDSGTHSEPGRQPAAPPADRAGEPATVVDITVDPQDPADVLSDSEWSAFAGLS